MTPKAKKALEGSIRKWERILTGDGVDKGWRKPRVKLSKLVAKTNDRFAGELTDADRVPQ